MRVYHEQKYFTPIHGDLSKQRKVVNCIKLDGSHSALKTGGMNARNGTVISL